MSSEAFGDAVLDLLTDSGQIVLVTARDQGVDDKTPLYDGHVIDSDAADMTISAPLPYLVFFTSPGLPVRPRAGRGSTMRTVEFQITGVGDARWQASWAGDLAERLLDARVVTPAGDRPRRITRTRDNTYMGRDDTWTRPGGEPLFIDVRRYQATTRR